MRQQVKTLFPKMYRIPPNDLSSDLVKVEAQKMRKKTNRSIGISDDRKERKCALCTHTQTCLQIDAIGMESQRKKNREKKRKNCPVLLLFTT